MPAAVALARQAGTGFAAFPGVRRLDRSYGRRGATWPNALLLVGITVTCAAAASPWSGGAQATDGAATPAGSLEVVARFEQAAPSGVAVTPAGRIFVSFPRHAQDHPGPTLAEVYAGQVLPFPDAATNALDERDPEGHLVSVHGITLDAAGRLWVVDDGKIAGRPIAPGAAKIVGFDPSTGAVVARVVILPPAMRPDSHLNDLRVDLSHGARGTAYVADSSFGASPALLVVDLDSGRQRRVLATHASTQPEPGFVAVLEGEPMRFDPRRPAFPAGGVDGITLAPDARRLEFSPLTSRRLYGIATATLADFGASDEALAAAVTDEGEKGFADGLATDARGRVYVTDAEHDAILRRWPDGHLDTVARDPRIVWPDGIFVTERWVYVTLAQSNRLPEFHEGRDLRQPPYLLVRAPAKP